MKLHFSGYTLRIRLVIERVLVFLLLPYAIFVLMECYDRNPYTEMYGTAFMFNVLLFELAALFFFAMTGSACASIRVLSLFALVFGLTNHYVMEFRSTPFVPWDLLSLGTGKTVVAEYDFTPTVRVVIVTLLLLFIFVYSKCLYLRTRKYRGFRAIAALVLAIILVVFAKQLQDRQFQVRNHLYPHVFTPDVMVKRNGAVVTFLMDLAYVHVDKPEDYSIEDAKAFYAEDTIGSGKEDLPNIIVIMDEAFSDLGELGDFTTSEDYMPFIHSLQSADDTVSGNLYVSVCGGNTANTEFEFLTGDTMAFLPAGSVPYQQYISTRIPSMASVLAAQGYKTVAMHPYYATGWSRNVVYPRMGFDTMYFYDDMQNLDKVRKYTSDASDFANILSTLRGKEEGRPLFLFNVTMQNHGGYTESYDDFVSDITVTSLKKQNAALNQYLSLIKLTDKAVEELLTALSGYEEKTIVVFFGDHQPSDVVTKSIAKDTVSQESDYFYSDDSLFTTLSEENTRYKVPYFIWANYDIEEQSDFDMSANYLGANVCRIAGVKTSVYQDFLMELQENYPVISSVYTKTNSQNEELLLTYEKLQYYQLFDWEEK